MRWRASLTMPGGEGVAQIVPAKSSIPARSSALCHALVLTCKQKNHLLCHIGKLQLGLNRIKHDGAVEHTFFDRRSGVVVVMDAPFPTVAVENDPLDA